MQSRYYLFKLIFHGCLFALIGCVTVPAHEANLAAAAPKTLLLDNDALWKLRNDIARGDGQEIALLLDKQARRSVECGPYSVTFKKGVPISGDQHDYMSLAPYYWPNPKTADHLPYVRRDGEINPETNDFGDEVALNKMTDCVTLLAIPSYVLNRDDFGKAAVRVLRDWFLDPKTRMNPHLKFANARRGHPGSEDGRAIGIEAGRVFPRVVDSIILLDSAGFLGKEDKALLAKWFSEYLEWLTTSSEGKEVEKESNNIGLIYFAQVADLALFLEKPEIALPILKRAIPRLIESTIEDDGRQPQELERTRSWAYSHTSLRHLFILGILSDQAGILPRLFDFQSPKGGSIRKALDFLSPYALRSKSWSYPQIQSFDSQRTAPFLWRAATIWNEHKYYEDASFLLKSVDVTDAIWVRLGSLEPI